MPFDFLKRNKADRPPSRRRPRRRRPRRRPARPAGTRSRASREEWRLTGTMDVDGRLSDALNKREPIAINDVRWAPVDGSSPLSEAPGLRSIDPYDLIIVLAGEPAPCRR